MSDQTGPAVTGDGQFIPDEQTTNIEGVDHRLVFVRDRYEPTQVDLRLHSLNAAVSSHTVLRFRYEGDAEIDVAGDTLATAERYYDFLLNYEAGNEAGS